MRMDARLAIPRSGPRLQTSLRCATKLLRTSLPGSAHFICDRFLSRPMKPYHSQFYDKNPISGWHAGGDGEIREEAARRDQQLSTQALSRAQQAERSTTEWRGRLVMHPAANATPPRNTQKVVTSTSSDRGGTAMSTASAARPTLLRRSDLDESPRNQVDNILEMPLLPALALQLAANLRRSGNDCAPSPHSRKAVDSPPRRGQSREHNLPPTGCFPGHGRRAD